MGIACAVSVVALALLYAIGSKDPNGTGKRIRNQIYLMVAILLLLATPILVALSQG